MAIDEITKAITTGTRTAQEPQADEDVSVIKDMAMGIPRGLEGAIQGTYNFFDYITGDELLPDYDTRYLGRSSTIAGGLVEGVSQFLTGFIPAVGVASKVGKFAQLSSKVGAKTALKVAKNNKNLKYSELRKLKGFKKKSKKQSILEGVAAGATADFMVFDAQEERLSNLLLMNESLRNPVTEYLAADGEDGEIEGRFKNVIEGLFLEAGIGGSVAAFIKTVKVIKARNAKLKEGKDKVEATQEALNESDLDADELANSRKEADEKLDADEAEIDDTGFNREPVETNFDDLSFQQLRAEAKRQGLPAGGTKADLKARLEEKQAKINEKVDDDYIPTGGSGVKNPTDEGAPKPDAGNEIPQSFKDDLKNDGSKQNKNTVNETVSIFKNLKTGGRQAILSAARAVKTSDAAAALARALSEKRLSEVTELPKTTAAELTRDSLRMAEIFGGDKNGWTARISKLGDSAEDLARVQAEQKSLYDLLNIYAEEISAMAKKFDEADKGNGLSVDSARTDLFSALDQYTEMQRIWSLYGRNLSLGLLQRKFLYKNGFRSRKFGFDTKKYKSKNAQEQYRNHARGSRSEKKMVKLLMLATSKDQIDDQLKALTKLSIGARGRALFDMNREYWINSLLSAPTTQLVNIMGNMLTYAMRSAEVAVGATLTGNTQLLKSQLNLAYHVESIRESWHLMKLALKSDEAITLANHRAFSDASHELGAITGDNMNAVFGGRLSEDGLLYNATNWMGTVARLPSRGLLGMDEFFKALSYRQYMRTELAVEGLNKGIKQPKALAKYVEEGLEQHLTTTGRAFSEENILRDANKLADEKGLRFKDRDDFVEEYMNTNYRPDDHYRVDENGTSHYIRGGETAEELSIRGQQYAMVNTHTQDSSLKSMRTISKLIAENPALTYVVPFVRTPTNILTFGVSRSALAMADFKGMGKALQGFKKEYREMMNQADRRTHAELVGRLSTAVSVSVALMYYINANKSFITGYGAKNKERRDAEKLGGFQEYSFRIPANSLLNSGDKDKYISYQRLDPMATMVGIIADIAEYSKYDESGTDSTASLMFSNLASTVVNNITNKSYVQGLDNLFNVLRDPTKNGEKFLGNIAGGYVPNIYNQAQNYQEDRMLRETRGIMDYMIKRTHGAKSLMPRRNLLGEIETVPQDGLTGVFNPLYTKEIPDSIVDQEIGSMNVGFSKPATLLANNKNLDMRDFSNETDQTAYDRYAELVGTVRINKKTLRESLEELMRSSFYEGLPDAEEAADKGLKSPRIKEIQKYLRTFRSVAKREMLKEYPELNQAFLAEHQNKINLMEQ
tara:strand:- start:5131 stop:9048 length:3918 start_codon:yes stop_codon:yes gene_type:complete